MRFLLTFFLLLAAYGMQAQSTYIYGRRNTANNAGSSRSVVCLQVSKKLHAYVLEKESSFRCLYGVSISQKAHSAGTITYTGDTLVLTDSRDKSVSALVERNGNLICIKSAVIPKDTLLYRTHTEDGATQEEFEEKVARLAESEKQLARPHARKGTPQYPDSMAGRYQATSGYADSSCKDCFYIDLRGDRTFTLTGNGHFMFAGNWFVADEKLYLKADDYSSDEFVFSMFEDTFIGIYTPVIIDKYRFVKLTSRNMNVVCKNPASTLDQ